MIEVVDEALRGAPSTLSTQVRMLYIYHDVVRFGHTAKLYSNDTHYTFII